MAPRRVTGLVLRLRDLGESDLLVDLFTREMGRATAVAKGGRRSKKRFFGLLLTAHVLEMDLSPTKKGGDLFRLESASLNERHLGLRLDHRRLLAAGPVLETLLRALAPLDPQPAALDLALVTLARMCTAADKAGMASALVIHLARLLGLTGYGLSLEVCVRCGRSAPKASRLALAGGALCNRCPGEGSWQVPPGLVQGLIAAAALPPDKLARLKLPLPALRPGLLYLAEFWRRVAMHDLNSLETAARVLV